MFIRQIYRDEKEGGREGRQHRGSDGALAGKAGGISGETSV